MVEQAEFVLRSQIDDEELRFDSGTAIKHFVDSERKYWEWLVAVSDRRTQVFSKGMHSQCIIPLLGILDRLSSGWELDEDGEFPPGFREVSNLFESMSFPFSTLARGELVSRIREVSEPRAVLLVYLMIHPLSTAEGAAYNEYKGKWDGFGSHSTYIKFLTEHWADLEAANRSLLELQYVASKEARDAQTRTLSSHINAVSQLHSDSETAASKHTDWINKFELKTEDWYKRVGSMFIRRGRRIQHSVLRDARAKQARAYETLNAAEDAFKSQVEFSETVGYWAQKEAMHSKARIGWGVALGAAIVSIAVVPYGIIRLPDGVLGVIKPENLIFGAIHPVKLSLVVLAVSISSYVTRFCSRQYATHQHLMLEAVERKTMLKTYIGLMLDNKLNESEDRRVALETLFRPGHTGMVEDPGGVTPSDSVIRIIDRQAPRDG